MINSNANTNNKPDENIADYMHQEMTGEEFCELFPNLSNRLVKLTNEEENHNRFQFKTGENEDNVSFNPTGTCQAGGIYFTDIDNIAIWLQYHYYFMRYCRKVSLPPDCRVYIEGNKFKADKIILDERVEIKDLPCWSDEDYCLNAVKQNTRSLLYVHDISYNIQLEGFKNNAPCTIKYISDREMQVTKEVQLEFVKIDWVAIRYLLEYKIDIPKEVQIEAVKKNHCVLKCLLEKKVDVSEEVKLEAVKHNWRVIIYLLENKVDVSEEVKLEAVKHNWYAITYLLEKKVYVSKEVQIEAVKQNYNAIMFLLEKKVDISEEVKLEAVKKNWGAIVNLLCRNINVSREVQIEAVKQNWRVIEYLIRYKVDISEEVNMIAKQLKEIQNS